MELSRKVLPSITGQEGFQLGHSHTPRAFGLLLMPGTHALSEALALLSTVAGMVVFLLFRRKLRCEPLSCSPKPSVFPFGSLHIP